MYDELIAELRRHHCDAKEDDTQEVCEECAYDVIIADKSVPSGIASVCVCGLMNRAADAIENTSKAYQMMAEAYEAEFTKHLWVPVTERLPDCEWGAEVGNIEWISCGMVFAGCFGRGGKYRDAYFRTWTDGTEGIDAKDADYWRPIQIPEPPKEETK